MRGVTYLKCKKEGKMKIKIMEDDPKYDFSHQINEFIKDKKVIDIKYCTQYIPDDDSSFWRSVLIMYEE